MIDAVCDPEVGSSDVSRYMFKEFLVSLGLFCHETSVNDVLQHVLDSQLGLELGCSVIRRRND